MNKNLFFYNFSFFSEKVLKKNYKKLFLKNNFYHQFNYNFCFKYILNKKNLDLFSKNNGYYLYSYNNLNKILFFNFFKNINFLFSNNSSILIVDSEFKLLLPIFNYFYGTKSLVLEKSFFFIKKSYLTRSNYLFLYSSFLKRHNIPAILVTDYSFFKKFFLFFSKLNVVVFSFLNENTYNFINDYYFNFLSSYKNIIKLIVLNRLISNYCYYYNFRLITFKKLYFEKIKNNLLLKY